MFKKTRIRSIIAILIMALLPLFMFIWMTYEKDLLYMPVYVAKYDIDVGTVIDDINKFFKIVRIDEAILINNSLTPKNASSIIGLGVKQFIPANSQVNDKYFSDPGIIVSGDKQVFKLPPSWIYAVPSSIRRGDTVKLYVIDSNIDSINYHSASNDLLPTYNGPVKFGSKEPILSTTVLYVKDGSNREVVDAAGSPQRYDGTSQVSSIEIVCTNDEIQKLIEYVHKGFKFILVY